MAYPKYKPEIKERVKRLSYRKKYWGNKKKSDKVAMKKYKEILCEMERIKKDPSSYEPVNLITKSPYYRQLLSVRSYIHQVKTKPNLSHKLPMLEEKLKKLSSKVKC